MNKDLCLTDFNDNLKFCTILTQTFKNSAPNKIVKLLRIINLNCNLNEITYMFHSQFKFKPCLKILSNHKNIELDILECSEYNAVEHNLGISMVFKLKSFKLTDIQAFNNFFIEILKSL